MVHGIHIRKKMNIVRFLKLKLIIFILIRFQFLISIQPHSGWIYRVLLKGLGPDRVVEIESKIVQIKNPAAPIGRIPASLEQDRRSARSLFRFRLKYQGKGHGVKAMFPWINYVQYVGLFIWHPK